jgi:hypothetical protein
MPVVKSKNYIMSVQVSKIASDENKMDADLGTDFM